MLSKKVRRLVVLLLTLLLVLSILNGCKPGKDVSEPTQTDKKATDSAATNDDTTDKDAPKEVVELDCFINFTWYTNEEFKGKIPDKITEMTGVTLNSTKAAEDKQLGLMIASGELPDLVFTSTELSRLSNPDISYSYNELIDKGYMPNFDPGAERIMNAKSFSNDDNYYTILSAFGTTDDWKASPDAIYSGPGLHIRQDLYEEMGSPKLETVDDFSNLMKSVKTEYPDMTPFIFNPFWRFTPFKVAFGVVSDGRYGYYYDNNGNVEFGIRSENYLDFLKYANSLYKDGIVSADNFAIKNESDVNGEFSGGRAFSVTWTSQAVINSNLKLTQNFPDAQAGLVIGLTSPNEPTLVQSKIGWAGVFVTKNCKDADAAGKLVDYLYSEDGRRLTCYGIEGEDWSEDENGNVVFTEEIIDIRSNDIPRWESEWNKGFYFGKQLEENIAFGILANSDPNKINKTVIECSDYYKGILDINPKLKLILPKEDTDEKVIYDKLVKLINDEEAKIIMSENDEDFMNNYNNLINIADNVGMKDLEAFLTEQYQALK